MLLLLGLMACAEQALPDLANPSQCPASQEPAELVLTISHADQAMAEVSALLVSVSEGPSDVPIDFEGPLTLDLTQGEPTVTVSGTFSYEGPNDTSGAGWTCSGTWSGCVVASQATQVELPLDCQITWQD